MYPKKKNRNGRNTPKQTKENPKLKILKPKRNCNVVES